MAHPGKGYGPTGSAGNNEYDRHYKWCKKYGFKPYLEYLAIVGPGRMGQSVYGPPNGSQKQKSRHRSYCHSVAGMFIQWDEYQRRIGKAPKAEEPTFLRPKEEIIANIIAKATKCR